VAVESPERSIRLWLRTIGNRRLTSWIGA